MVAISHCLIWCEPFFTRKGLSRLQSASDMAWPHVSLSSHERLYCRLTQFLMHRNSKLDLLRHFQGSCNSAMGYYFKLWLPPCPYTYLNGLAQRDVLCSSRPGPHTWDRNGGASPVLLSWSSELSRYSHSQLFKAPCSNKCWQLP